MSISDIFAKLIDRPNTPKVYRELRDYYKSAGLSDEANAFTYLLKELFHELPNADMSDANPQQR